jgi:sugar diacid utilization regulator/GAF domain-containing protein
MKENLSYRQLKSLIYVSNVLNSSLDIDTIIDSILQTTISVIDAADGGVLFLYNEEEKHLIAKSTTGFDPVIVNQVRLKPGESMTGLTFTSKQCQLYHSTQDVKSKTRLLSSKNLRLMEESIPRYPYSTLCAPIFLKEECIGVITLDSFNREKKFTGEDIELLKAISHQAAIAIEKGRFYHEKQQSIQKLQTLNDQMTAHNQMLTQSVNLHRNLADLVLKGKDLHNIIDYLQKAIGENFFLFDRNTDLLASGYKDTFEENTIFQLKDAVLHLMKDGKVSRQYKTIELEGQPFHLLLLPIGLMPDLFGVLCAVSNEKMNKINTAALEHACTVLSLEIVKEEAIFDTRQKAKGAFLDDVLQGKMNDSILRQAKLLNIQPNRQFMVACLQFEQAPSTVEKDLLERRRIIHIFYRRCQEKYPDSLIVSKHDQIIILFSTTTEEQNKNKLKLLKSGLLSEIKKTEEKEDNIEIYVGLGRWKKGLEAVYLSAKEANQCLQFIHQYNKTTKILHYPELGMHRLLMKTSAEEMTDYISEQLGPLLDQKGKKHELLDTLICYTDNNMNAKITSEELHIHPNTLHYRINRIQDLLSCNFQDAQQLLNLQLALRLFKLVG